MGGEKFGGQHAARLEQHDNTILPDEGGKKGTSGRN